MGLWDIEARFRENDFESKVLIEENANKYMVTHIDFASISSADDFNIAGRMMLEVAEIVNKLNGE